MVVCNLVTDLRCNSSSFASAVPSLMMKLQDGLATASYFFFFCVYVLFTVKLACLWVLFLIVWDQGLPALQFW